MNHAAAFNECWRMPYDLHHVASCISKITSMSFNEIATVCGGAFSVMPVSSGFSIGSCNWVVKGPKLEKMVYLGNCTVASQRHPAVMELSPLEGADALLCSSLVEASQETKIQTEVGKLTAHIELTLKRGGNVLLPVTSAGTLFDLFEVLFLHLRAKNLAHTRVFFVSPIAKQSLAYSTITGEWLRTDKLDRVYSSQVPFIHNELMSMGLLHALTDVNEMIMPETGSSMKSRPVSIFSLRQPCIVLAGHPSLRFGPVLQLLLRWYNNPKNSMILTEPGFVDITLVHAKLHALAAANRSSLDNSQAPLPLEAMIDVVACPIDPRLRTSQASELLRTLRPARVVIPSRFAPQFQGVAHPSLITISHLQALKIPLPGQFEKGFMTDRLHAQMRPVQVGDVSIVNVRAALSRQERGFVLDALPDPLPEDMRAHQGGVSGPVLWGSFLPAALMASLSKRGITDVTVAQNKKKIKTERPVTEALERGHVRLEIPSLQAKLVLKPGSSQITTQVEASRCLLRDVLIEQLIHTPAP